MQSVDGSEPSLVENDGLRVNRGEEGEPPDIRIFESRMAVTVAIVAGEVDFKTTGIREKSREEVLGWLSGLLTHDVEV